MPFSFPRSLRRLLAAAALGVVGCNSPTLPLPPPDQPDSVSPCTDSCMGEGCYEVQGSVDGSAVVIGLSPDSGSGAVQQADPATGRYTLRIRGVPGGVVEVWYRIGTRDSASITVELPQ